MYSSVRAAVKPNAGVTPSFASNIGLKPVFHFARIVPKRTGEHAQIEKRFIKHVLPGVFAYQNKKFVASQLFGVLRKY
jgi:hypothetical protein